MPTTYAIPNGRTVMDATTYTSNGGVQTVTNAAGFKPDFVWIKDRASTTGHDLVNSVAGASKYLMSNTTGAEVTDANFLTAFNSNGFSLGSSNYNGGDAFVGWQWQAGQGTNTSNTNGSITSTVSVNATAGFSVVTYTGTGSNATIGHGLSSAPAFIAIKVRNNTYSWRNYHVSTGNTGYTYFNSTDGYTASSTTFNNTTPTSSVFSVGTEANTNASGGTYVAYCWAPVAGFSQFGSYTGNGSTDGPFVYLGFRPKFIMVKSSSAVASWFILDTARNTYNAAGNSLYANLSIAEDTGYYVIDALSNGFKLRSNYVNANNNGDTYIYAAFAENPFKYSNAR